MDRMSFLGEERLRALGSILPSGWGVELCLMETDTRDQWRSWSIMETLRRRRQRH
jgi:hypothetical protein